jgi:hypothetical protein
MKTHLVQVAPFDDNVSVRDKMAWGKSDRILIVWPRSRTATLDRRLDAEMIKRRADELGAQLAFVARSRDVRYHAKALGIPVFRTMRDAQNRPWPPRPRDRGFFRRSQDYRGDPDGLPDDLYQSRQRARAAGNSFLAGGGPDWIRHPLARSTLLTIGLMAVLSIAAFLLPSAEVRLTPELRNQQLTFVASTGPTIEAINVGGGVPAQPITVVLGGRATVETTGSVELPHQRATGRVDFTNLTDQPIVIPAGTIVADAANGLRFRTTEQGLLGSEAGSQATVSAEAVQPGPEGNVQAGAIDSVEGTLGLQMRAANQGPFLGGNNQTLRAVTELDRGQAFRSLVDELRLSAADEILLTLDAEDILISQTPFLVNTLEETYSAGPGEPGDILEASARLEFQALVVDFADLEALAVIVLDSALDQNFTAQPETLAIEVIEILAVSDDGRAEWQMRASRDTIAVLTGGDVINQVSGQPQPVARDRLSRLFLLAEPAEIDVTPTWWPRLPFLGFRIDVIENER